MRHVLLSAAEQSRNAPMISAELGDQESNSGGYFEVILSLYSGLHTNTLGRRLQKHKLIIRGAVHIFHRWAHGARRSGLVNQYSWHWWLVLTVTIRFLVQQRARHGARDHLGASPCQQPSWGLALAASCSWTLLMDLALSAIQTSTTSRAVNEVAKFHSDRRRPLLGHSPCWKRWKLEPN